MNFRKGKQYVMRTFTVEQGVVIPLDRPNVDTDAIIPKQFLKSIQRSGFGDNLFDEWRYLDQGKIGLDCSKRPLNTEFKLNQARYRGGSILLTRENFGCGSSREHAIWALADFGIRVIIAPNFADIFFNNASKNGMLAVELAENIVNELFRNVQMISGYHLTVNLRNQAITLPNDDTISFELDEFRKHSLLNGLDDIDLTLQYADDIQDYEKRREQQVPWLFK